MKRKMAFLLAAVIIGSVSCNVFDNDEPYIPNSLEGTWKWQRTTGGFAGVIIDADSVDYTRKLVIKENAKAYIYKNGHIIYKFDIKFEDHEWLWTEGPSWVFYPLNDQNRPSMFVLELESNELVLQDPCTDCYTQYFTKD